MYDEPKKTCGRHRAASVAAVALTSLFGAATAEPNAGTLPVDSSEFAGIAEVAMTEACASACHGFDEIFGGPRRVPSEWDTVVEDMIGKGMMASDEQLLVVGRYLKWAWGTVWINRATADDLVAFLAISPDEAESIIAFREANGPFADVESLKAVPGVDAAAIDAQAGAILFD